MEEVLIVKFGEIALRGKNRYIFENKLIKAIENNIKDFSGYSVSREMGRYVVRCAFGAFDFDLVAPRVAAVLGVVACCPCVRDKNMGMDNINKLALLHVRQKYGKAPFSFKVTAKRTHKDYPYTSPEIAALAGGYILENMENLTVNLSAPDVTVSIELRNYVYIYSEEIRGFGGLPVGSCGKAMSLLSAGIDSPVASFLMAKRGVMMDAVYFHSPPYTSERALLKVTDICEALKIYTAISRLHVVNFTALQLKLKEKTPPEKFTIMLKRSMMRCAERLAAAGGCEALVTGDSVGQVASQTLKSIAAIESFVSLPVIRPLAGMDKHEITRIARKIGTYEISIRPFEDCCTLFVPPHPETKPKVSIIERIENRIDGLLDLTEEAVSSARVIDY